MNMNAQNVGIDPFSLYPIFYYSKLDSTQEWMQRIDVNTDIQRRSQNLRHYHPGMGLK